MALYKYDKYLKQTDEAAYDALHSPGEKTPYSGIYRCEGCGYEIVSEGHKPFPPQDHHTHTASQGKIQWKLVVYAQHKGS